MFHAKEKLDLLFHSPPFSPFTPLRKCKATSEWLYVSDGLYKHRRSLQMAKINMRVLLKDMFTQTICSAPEIMNKWRFYWNNWKDFFVCFCLCHNWMAPETFISDFPCYICSPVPFYELNTSSCRYFTHVFVRNCRLLLQFHRVAWFPKRSLAASKGYLDLAGQENEGKTKGQERTLHAL